MEEATDRCAVRDQSLVRLLHGATPRRNEVVSLRKVNVQLHHADSPRVLALHKGKREREPTLIGKLAAGSLRAWLKVRGDIGPTDPVFVRIHAACENPKALGGEAVWLMLRSRA